MVVVLALFVLAEVILFIGMIGDRDETNRTNYTYAFCALVFAIVFILYKFM